MRKERSDWKEEVIRVTTQAPFLVLHRPLLNILARDAAKEGFSATIKAVFITARYFLHMVLQLTSSQLSFSQLPSSPKLHNVI